MTISNFSEADKILIALNTDLDECVKTLAFGYYMTAKLEALACDWLRYQRDQPPVPGIVRDALEQQFAAAWRRAFLFNESQRARGY